MFIAYNLRHLFNILDPNEFKNFLKELAHLFFNKTTSQKQFTSKISAAPILQLPTCIFKTAA